MGAGDREGAEGAGGLWERENEKGRQERVAIAFIHDVRKRTTHHHIIIRNQTKHIWNELEVSAL